MVKTKDQVVEIVRSFVKEISKDYRVVDLILFGSYAHGVPRPESDIDLAVVSPDFSNMSEMEILQFLSRKAMKVDTSLEVVAFTPEELLAPDPRSFSYQVKSLGISIAV